MKPEPRYDRYMIAQLDYSPADTAKIDRLQPSLASYEKPTFVLPAGLSELGQLSLAAPLSGLDANPRQRPGRFMQGIRSFINLRNQISCGRQVGRLKFSASFGTKSVPKLA